MISTTVRSKALIMLLLKSVFLVALIVCGVIVLSSYSVVKFVLILYMIHAVLQSFCLGKEPEN